MNPQIPQYNSYGPSGQGPFLFNATYDINQANEANTYDNVAREFQHLHGSDIVFMPRELGKTENIFGEYLASKISKGIPMRVFIEENEAWSGGGDMYSRFGLQVTDECTIHTNKTSWLQATTPPSGEPIYPKQNDLIFINKTQKLFEIQHIEDEISPGFYLFGNRTSYKIQCKMYSYSHEQISQAAGTNIPEAVKALDNLLGQQDFPEEVKLPQKEINNHNIPIQNNAFSIIDNTEDDPLV